LELGASLVFGVRCLELNRLPLSFVAGRGRKASAADFLVVVALVSEIEYEPNG
jgi:hypothetical protein